MGPAITHGTPFASHTFVPPSGAPGFTGDRQWDKGFEFDKTQVERRSVRLTGRKEVTTPVLNVALADQLRPFLPALARLPKSWSLLYSLDQHGISLNTLYTRCQDFKGSQLLVVRDSGETLFGAWMGEGIHPSKGAYYGSGESYVEVSFATQAPHPDVLPGSCGRRSDRTACACSSGQARTTTSRCVNRTTSRSVVGKQI